MASPGPSTYDVQVTQVKRRKPGYSMSRASKYAGGIFDSIPDTPGPSAYSTNIEAIKGKRPSARVQVRHDRQAKNPTPGPADYKKAHFLDAQHKAQSFTKEALRKNIEESPGPSDYDVDHNRLRKRNAAYSIPSAQRPKSREIFDPSPQSYDTTRDPVYTKVKAGITHGLRPKPEKGFITPAPTAYDTNKSTLDGPKHVIATRLSKKSAWSTPGPLDYSPDQPQKKVIAKTMSAKSLYQSMYKNNSNPGPADYNTRDTRTLSHSQSQPAFSMPRSKSGRGQQEETTPGPTDYENHTQKLKTRRQAPGYTMPKKERNTIDTVDGPGPAPLHRSIDAEGYNRLKDRKPAYTMRGKGSNKKSTHTPGPGNYFEYEKSGKGLNRSTSAAQLRERRGLAFGLKPKPEKKMKSPGPGAYSPYDHMSLARSASNSTLRRPSRGTKTKTLSKTTSTAALRNSMQNMQVAVA